MLDREALVVPVGKCDADSPPHLTPVVLPSPLPLDLGRWSFYAFGWFVWGR